MKIGLITSAYDEMKAGIATYISNLILSINRIDKINEYTLIHHSKVHDEMYRSNKELIIPYPRIPLKKTIGENFYLSLKLKKYNFDIVHELGQKNSFIFNFPSKKILTIHDLTPMLFPQTHGVINVFLHKFLLPKAAKNADKIIADSENTKKDVINYLGIPQENIKVIHCGVSENFKIIDKENDKKRIDLIRLKHGLPEKYILTVSTLEPRKNLLTLIKAYHKLKKNKIKHKLIVIGAKGWKYHNIFNAVKQYNLENDVIFLGFIPNNELPVIYNLSDIFVYPSIYEGFGLPPLEAMACGIPVVTSNTSALPEVVGNAGIMVNPYNPDEFTNAFYEVINNEGLKKEMIEKGLERVKTFSWEKNARETKEIYDDVTTYNFS